MTINSIPITVPFLNKVEELADIKIALGKELGPLQIGHFSYLYEVDAKLLAEAINTNNYNQIDNSKLEKAFKNVFSFIDSLLSLGFNRCNPLSNYPATIYYDEEHPMDPAHTTLDILATAVNIYHWVKELASNLQESSLKNFISKEFSNKANFHRTPGNPFESNRENSITIARQYIVSLQEWICHKEGFKPNNMLKKPTSANQGLLFTSSL